MNIQSFSTTKLSHSTPLYDSNLSIVTKVLISVALFFFAFSLPLTSLFTSQGDIQGIWMLLIGWAGIIIFQLAWFANPLNLLALLLINKQPLLALALSILALLLASQSLNFSEIPTGLKSGKTYIKEMGLGFYFWYLSHALFLLSILNELISRHKKTETSPVF